MPDSDAYQYLFAPLGWHSPFLNGWHSLNAASLGAIPSEWRNWVYHKGSLTTRLVDFSKGNFRVRVLREYWKTPSRYETVKLVLPSGQVVRARDVELLCDGRPVVFARTVIPLALYQREKNVFNGMGTRPLGHYLFREGEIKNTQRDVKRCRGSSGKAVYARATPYEFRGSELLVREFFIDDKLISATAK